MHMWNIVRIRFMASEEMLFENVLYYKLTYEPSAQVS